MKHVQQGEMFTAVPTAAAFCPLHTLLSLATALLLLHRSKVFIHEAVVL